MGPIKIHNGGNYAHAQDSNAYTLRGLNFAVPAKNLQRAIRKIKSPQIFFEN